jgi:methionyl-tRNA synthetase
VANNEALHQVCSVLVNAFAVLTRYLASPCCPHWPKRCKALSASPWKTGTWTADVLAIHPYQHLMQRVTPEQLDALFEPKEAVAPGRTCASSS